VPRIKPESVEAVKLAADMVEVVSGRTQLRRAGARWTGRCPFHEERTPSFSVNAQEKLYYCFGCGRGGDLISFVRETENLDFAEAVELIADRFNVPLEYEEAAPGDDARRKRRERLLELLDAAAAFYERYLWEAPRADFARDYLAGRGLREEVAREYRLGLAPGGSTLARKALERGFAREELAACGLLSRRGADTFQRRLLFPLADARGRVLGFGARRLFDDDPIRAKYVNSAEGELFHKAAIVYGLDRARQAVAKEDRAVVVEGYTDVLALRQAGVEPVVASMGTALTQSQLKELARLTHRLYLCFDADAAGEDATLRGMELAAGQGFEVRVVALPPGLDPADAADGFEQRLGAAESLVHYRVRLELERAADRQEAFVRTREILARFEDSPERLDALRLVADRLDLPRDTLAGFAPVRSVGAAARGQLSPRVVEAGERLERSALAGCLAHPELLRILAELGPEHFDDERHRRLRDGLVAGSPPADDLVALTAELDARAEEEGIDAETAEQLLLRLRERTLRRQLADADPERTRDLQEALQRLRATFEELASAQPPR
jgi:DNA primase